jgi:competence protein ComEA
MKHTQPVPRAAAIAQPHRATQLFRSGLLASALALLALPACLLPLVAQSAESAEDQAEPSAQQVAQASQPATVNINTADAQTLSRALQGVGPSRAEEIVRYRETYGPFKTLDELAEVKGIGQSTLERNRALITLE